MVSSDGVESGTGAQAPLRYIMEETRVGIPQFSNMADPNVRHRFRKEFKYRRRRLDPAALTHDTR